MELDKMEVSDLDVYEKLGVPKIINAAGTYTAIGASRMSSETLRVLTEAAKWNVDIRVLHNTLNQRIAEHTHNEAAYICNSCSAAIYLGVAACISKHYNREFNALTREQIACCEVIAMWGQHFQYDQIVEQLGAKLRFVGYPNMYTPIDNKELEAVYNENTVCGYFVPLTPRGYYGEGCMNLENFLISLHNHNVPLLVDCAAQLPPKSNLWEYTNMGADIVCFSGGKDLRGPQASGLMLGKKAYIEIVSSIGFPNLGYGRMMKIGREEMIALYSALCQYLEADEDARKDSCERQVEILISGLKVAKHFSAERSWPNQAGQPLPRGFVKILDNSVKAEQLRKMLLNGTPSIFCYSENKNGVYINPMCLEAAEMEKIVLRLLEIDQELSQLSNEGE